MNSLPKRGACHCKPGVQRDNCPDCEGSGVAIDWAEYHRRNPVTWIKNPSGERFTVQEAVRVHLQPGEWWTTERGSK